MRRNNPHIVRVKSDPVFGDCPEWQDRYAREHGVHVLSTRLGACFAGGYLTGCQAIMLLR